MKAKQTVIIVVAILFTGLLVVRYMPNPTPEQIHEKAVAKELKIKAQKELEESRNQQYIDRMEEQRKIEESKSDAVRQAEVVSESVNHAVNVGTGLFILGQLLK